MANIVVETVLTVLNQESLPATVASFVELPLGKPAPTLRKYVLPEVTE